MSRAFMQSRRTAKNPRAAPDAWSAPATIIGIDETARKPVHQKARDPPLGLEL